MWRVKSGPDCEVFFPQTHVPGEQGQSDFTDMRELEVVIAGEPFAHLLYHFVLTYSNWESARQSQIVCEGLTDGGYISSGSGFSRFQPKRAFQPS